MKELRGIIYDYPKGVKRIRLLTRGQRGDDYFWTTFPSDKPFNKGQIIKLLGETYGVPPGEIKIAPHIKIKEKK